MKLESPTKQLHQQANTLLDNGRLTEARNLYEQICTLDENDAHAWLIKGAIDGEMGKVGEALSHVRKAITIDPDYADAYHTLAHLLVSQRNIEGARDSLQKAVELEPEFTKAWVMLAGIQGQLQAYREAEECSRRALQQDSSIVEAHMCLGSALSLQGNLKDATASYRSAAQLQPTLQAAWSRLGTALLQLKDFTAAEEALKQALTLNSDDITAQVCLAHIHINKGQLDDAFNQLQSIILKNPDNEDAWNSLVLTCSQSVNSSDWIEFCQHITELHPNCGLAWLGLGYALEHHENLEPALENYQKAINLAPHLHDAWSRIGVIYARQDRFDEAQEYFREALARGSEAPVTHCGYGSMLRRKGWFQESEEHLRLATERSPEWVSGLTELSRVLLDQGRFAETCEVLLRAVALDPDNKDAASGLAEVYERTGRHEEGYAVLKPFLESGDTNSQIVCIFAKLSGALNRQGEALSWICETLEQDTNLSAHQKLDLNFRAAEIYRVKKSYDKAMHYYRQGNALKPVVYDPHHHHKFISDAIALFTQDTLTTLPRVSITSSRPVFIVGMPRSGTSLVEQILSCHDQVYGAGELMDIGNAASTLGFRRDMQVPSVKHFRSIPQGTLDSIAADYLEKLKSISSSEARVTDKMPGNFIHLGLIQILFPEARIIHIRRNPLDNCLSCYFTDFNGVHEYAYGLENLGHYYCEYQRLMDHWRSTLSLPLLDISYEDLVSDVEETSRRLVEFCNLEWNAKVLDFHKSGRLVNTASYQQINRPVYTSSIARWKHYEPHLGPLREALSSCQEHSASESS